MTLKKLAMGIFVLFVIGLITACGNDADSVGVGAQCLQDTDCKQEGQKCLTQFKGGYCGVENCVSNAGCPENSICVTHTDEKNYCFRTCIEKIECNANRDLENESNCSSNVTLFDGTKDHKACVPPSSGT